jgi:Zn-dependent protease
MRDPMNWALTLFRAFGVRVRLHLLYPVLMLGLIIRVMAAEGNVVTWLDAVLLLAVVPFCIILCHEFGHVFAGRSVGGDSEEILMWPLGGLAFVSSPGGMRDWKAHTIIAAGGPLVNVVICFATAVLLAGAGFLPTVNPITNPFVLDVKNYRDGKLYTGPYELRQYQPDTEPPVLVFPTDGKRYIDKPEVLNERAAKSSADRALAPAWVTWTNRVFWVSWVLLLFNLLPAFPLDGGQILQGLIWWRSDYSRGTTVACTSGYVVGVLFLVLSVGFNEASLMGLGMFMLFQSWITLRRLEMDSGEFGYDYSGGYAGTLADDDEPKKKPRKPGFLKRWLQARAARRLQRETEAKARDEERMDQLLDKIAHQGKQSLTAEENAFMQRVSQRYRKQ